MARSFVSKSVGRGTARVMLLGGVAAAALFLGSLDVETPSFSYAMPGEGSVSVGSFRLEGGLISAAFAQSGTVTLEDIVFENAFTTVRLPSITFEGTSLGREALRQALTGTGDRSWPDLLATIDARLVRAPALFVDQEIEGTTQRVVYSALEARDVTQGVIGRLSVESTTLDDPADRSVAVAVGETVVDGFDLVGTARFYTQAAEPDADNPMRTLYGRFSMTDMRARAADGVEIRVAEIVGSAFSARLLERPFTAFLEEMADAAGAGGPSREEARAGTRFLVDLYRSLEFGSLSVRDVTATVPEFGGEVMRIGRIGLGSEGAGPEGGIAIEAIAFDAEGVNVLVDRVYSAGFSFDPTFEGLAALLERDDFDFDAVSARALVPTLGKFGIEGVVASIVPEGEDDPIDFTLAAFHVTTDAPVSGIPSVVSARLEDLAFAIPEDAQDEAAQTLLDLGYRDVAISASLAARWNEADETLAVEEFAIAGREMGRFALGAQLGNVGPGILSQSEAVRMMTLFGATAQRLTLAIDDDGLAVRILEQQAREQGVPAQVLQEQSAMMATAMLPMMMGNTPQSRELGAAIGAFVARPGTLDLVMTARDPDGIPLVLLADLGDPMALLQLIDIAASAR